LPPPQSPPASAPEPTPSPTLELTAQEQEALDETLAALDEYLTRYVALATDEDIDPITDPGWAGGITAYGNLSDGVADLINPHANFNLGRINVGTLTWEFIGVEEVDLDLQAPRMTVLICVDESEWSLVDRDSRDVVEGPGDSYIATVESIYLSDEHDRHRQEEAWRVRAWDDHDRSRQC
jgi:hypothetical protein